MESEKRSIDADLDAALIKIENLENSINGLIDEMEMWVMSVRYVVGEEVYIPSFHISSRLRP